MDRRPRGDRGTPSDDQRSMIDEPTRRRGTSRSIVRPPSRTSPVQTSIHRPVGRWVVQFVAPGRRQGGSGGRCRTGIVRARQHGRVVGPVEEQPAHKRAARGDGGAGLLGEVRHEAFAQLGVAAQHVDDVGVVIGLGDEPGGAIAQRELVVVELGVVLHHGLERGRGGRAQVELGVGHGPGEPRQDRGGGTRR